MKAVIVDMPKRWMEERRASEASCRDEMWEGVLHMAPMPNLVHQKLVRDLLILLLQRWAVPNGGDVVQEVNLTTPADESEWTRNYRVPDIVLLSADRLHYQRVEYIAGPPLVCIEIRSTGDESYEKLPFYARLGVPEVWILDRDTKQPEVFALAAGAYETMKPDATGWIQSPAVGVIMKAENERLLVRFKGDAEATTIPS